MTTTEQTVVKLINDNIEDDATAVVILAYFEAITAMQKRDQESVSHLLKKVDLSERRAKLEGDTRRNVETKLSGRIKDLKRVINVQSQMIKKLNNEGKDVVLLQQIKDQSAVIVELKAKLRKAKHESRQETIADAMEIINEARAHNKEVTSAMLRRLEVLTIDDFKDLA